MNDMNLEFQDQKQKMKEEFEEIMMNAKAKKEETNMTFQSIDKEQQSLLKPSQ